MSVWALTGLAAGQSSNLCQFESTGAHDMPWLLYADQSNPSETGLVDDAAIFQAQYGSSSDGALYGASKTIGDLLRPTGIVVVSDELFWTEQDKGTLRSCKTASTARVCTSETVTLISGLNCPKGVAIDFARSQAYIIQYGGGDAADRAMPCRGAPRISRTDLLEAVDGSSAAVDIISDPLVMPTAIAMDPRYVDSGVQGLLFWTDPGYAGGAVMRCRLDGTGVQRVLSISSPAGIALDSGRQAIYVTQQVAGASVIASSYNGLHGKHVTRFLFFEPSAVAVDASDGAVYIVETDSFEEPCDPLANGGLGATLCTSRNRGRISRISCAWPPELSIDGLQVIACLTPSACLHLHT